MKRFVCSQIHVYVNKMSFLGTLNNTREQEWTLGSIYTDLNFHKVLILFENQKTIAKYGCSYL